MTATDHALELTRVAAEAAGGQFNARQGVGEPGGQVPGAGDAADGGHRAERREQADAPGACLGGAAGASGQGGGEARQRPGGVEAGP